MEIYLTLGIFGLAFLFIIIEKFDKSIIALSGAMLMVIFRILTPEEAIDAIEFETILLLLAMMILVHIASKSGIFQWLNTKIAGLTKGNPVALFVLFCLMTGFFSAFLDNVTTVILIIPMTIELIRGMGRDPKPYIFGEIIFSNIGGGLTLIGDPPNIIIGEIVKLSFLDFIVNLWIPILFSSILVLGVFLIIYWKKIKPISKDLVELHIANILIQKIRDKFLKVTLNKSFIIKVLSILGLTFGLFMVQKSIGLPNYIIAFSAALVLGMLTAKKVSIHDSFKSVEWTTLFFFAGLFIMVAAIEKTGILEQIGHFILHSTTDLMILALLVLWISGLVSMIVDNIPFVTVMIPIIFVMQKELGGIDTSILWWALSLGACLGGNGTLIGASANVVSADIAKKNGVNVSFLNYMKFSFPLTIGVLLVCSIYVVFKTI